MTTGSTRPLKGKFSRYLNFPFFIAMKDPAVLFYTSDFLTGTMTMTDEQVGKYIRLLCLQHQKKRLSEKDMLHICKSYDEDIWCKFARDDAGYYNERMAAEADKRRNYAESRRNNRKKKDMSNISKTYVHHMENENENENVIVTKNETTSITRAKRFSPPTRDEVDQYAKTEMIGSETSVDKFHDYYTANGWKVGRNAMKDWKAAFRNWIKNEKQYQANGTHQQAPAKYDGVTSSRSKADWDALQQWGVGIDEYRDKLFGGIGGPEDTGLHG